MAKKCEKCSKAREKEKEEEKDGTLMRPKVQELLEVHYDPTSEKAQNHNTKLNKLKANIADLKSTIANAKKFGAEEKDPMITSFAKQLKEAKS